MFKPSITSLIVTLAVCTSAGAYSEELITIKPTSRASAESSGTPYELVRLDWEDTLKPGAHLTLINPWGNISLRQNTGKQASLHAVMQVIGDDKKIARLELREMGNDYELEFIYPETAIPETVSHGRIDAALLIPENIEVMVKGERGKIASKTLHIPLEVTTNSEPVSVKTTSTLIVNGQSGNVDVHILASSAEPNHDNEPRAIIKTISGDVNVRYYPDLSLAFELVSGRDKTTNDLALLQSRRLEGRKVLMQHDNASERLIIQTDTGYIRLINTGAEFPSTE